MVAEQTANSLATALRQLAGPDDGTPEGSLKSAVSASVAVVTRYKGDNVTGTPEIRLKHYVRLRAALLALADDLEMRPMSNENSAVGTSHSSDLRAENNKLRRLLADSPLPCIYCGLPKEDIGKCQSGFPGCGRADNMTVVAGPRSCPDCFGDLPNCACVVKG